MRPSFLIGAALAVSLGAFVLFAFTPFPDDAASVDAGNADGAAVEIATVARVIDGDTVELTDGRRVRYIGMNAPESLSVSAEKPAECFGAEAARRNASLVEGAVIRLERDAEDTDKYGRLLRYLWRGAELVNALLVREGYARILSIPPNTRRAAEFRAAEEEARRARRGLWGACGEALAETPACAIKGNVSASGKKLYHLPGCPYYENTVVDPLRGERWFCSEAEAGNAGWRKAAHCP